MMGRQTADQSQLFYEFHLEERVPPDHLLRRIDVFTAAALADLRHKLAEHYSHTGRPSIDPELLIRMLLLGYCYGIRIKSPRSASPRSANLLGQLSSEEGTDVHMLSPS